MFISQAWAQAAAPGGVDIMSMMPIILMFVVLYFVMIRPQMKRGKEHKAMIDALQKGDEVVAAGGIVGKITRLNENYVTLQVADNVEIRVQRLALLGRCRPLRDATGAAPRPRHARPAPPATTDPPSARNGRDPVAA